MKTPKHDHKTRILLIDSMTAPQGLQSYANVLTATVATLGDDSKPRNWVRPYFTQRIKGDTGGMTVSLFKCSHGGSTDILASNSAPSVKASNASEYLEVAQALKGFYARLVKLDDTQGWATTEVEKLIRMIIAMKVVAIYSRPDKEIEGWLHKGEWIVESIGEFKNRLTHFLAKSAKESIIASA